jgi:hypothetical protein
MALSKIGTEAVEHISSSANATFLTIDASEQITVASEGGAVTTSVQQGLAKCWVNFNGTGTIATRDSVNIASMTDSGVGTFSMNLSNAMGNDDYAMSGCVIHSDAGGFDDATVISRNSTQTSSVSTTVNPFYAYRVEGVAQLQDCRENMVILHGDLA